MRRCVDGFGSAWVANLTCVGGRHPFRGGCSIQVENGPTLSVESAQQAAATCLLPFGSPALRAAGMQRLQPLSHCIQMTAIGRNPPIEAVRNQSEVGYARSNGLALWDRRTRDRLMRPAPASWTRSAKRKPSLNDSHRVPPESYAPAMLPIAGKHLGLVCAAEATRQLLSTLIPASSKASNTDASGAIWIVLPLRRSVTSKPCACACACSRLDPVLQIIPS